MFTFPRWRPTEQEKVPHTPTGFREARHYDNRNSR
jgi:hypothetical protein